MNLLVVFLADGLRHVEEERGFPGARGRDDESALSATDGGDDIHDTGGVAVGSGFKSDALVRVDRLELVEMRERGGFLWGDAVYGIDSNKLRAAVTGLVLAVEPLAVAQCVAADEFWGNENIFLCLLEVRFREAEETETFGGELEDAVRIGQRA